ncbi:leucine-rich repeat extensin-like protein 1 [Sesamum indicum]|uniref:Leucine-rich repeat extensin-like protein 1 n=1 Tax=Sesamum indicum TaxID=4182 RepID=A0A6I9ULQ9_SESIN|nr:leucine-rich repeat extensin-like protein 1 [Sesamum indicum]
MSKPACMLVILLLILQSSFSTKADYVPDPSIKCGECPCVSPCSPPPPSLPLPPPTMVYVSPPPPQFVYETGLTPPPPPGFVYETGPPGNVYPSDNPFDLAIYSNSAHTNSLMIGILFLTVVVVSTLQLLVYW